MHHMRLVATGLLLLTVSCGGGESGPAPDDTTPPTVSLTIPAGLARGPVNLTATAADAGGIRDVVFLVDGTPINTPDDTPPYSTVWSSGLSPNGGRLITATATDNAGNAATSTGVVLSADNFRVQSFEPLISPTVQLWPTVTVTFNAALDPSTLTGLFIYEGALDLLAGTAMGQSNNTLEANAPFVPGKTYEVRATPILERSGDELPLGATFTHFFSSRNPLTAPVFAGFNHGQQILLEPNGTVHLIGVWGGVLTSATCTSACGSAASWSSSQVQGGASSFAPAAVIDAGSAMHVLFAGSGLNYATCASGCGQTANWSTGVVDSVDKAGMWTSMVVDNTGVLHAVYTNWKDGLLYYATCSASCTVDTNWNKGALPANMLSMQDLSLAQDSTGVLHLVFRGQAGNAYPIKYATCAASCTVTGNWQELILESPPLPGSGSTLRADENGLHHAYYQGATGLRYATCMASCLALGNWTMSTIDPAGSGISTGMATFGLRRWIVYGGAQARLRVASCLTNCSQGGISWRAQLLDQTDNSGAFTDAVFDASGQPRFVYGHTSTTYAE